MSPFRSLGLVLVVVLAGCETTPSETRLEIDSDGTLAGLVFLDRDGDSQPSAGDLAARQVAFSMVRGQHDTVASGTTDEHGLAVLPAVPVGTYRLVVDPDALGDSLVAAGEGVAVVTAGDTVAAPIPLQYPLRSVRDVADLPDGRVVALEAVALNGWAAWRDSTVHLADSTGVIRSLHLPASPITTGDTVRLIGRTETIRDARVVTGIAIYVKGRGDAPQPVDVSTAVAGSADAGTLAAALVHITDARIVDATRTSAGDLRLRVDDGSGGVDILLDRDAGIVAEVPLIPGVRVSSAGLLVPDGSTGYRLQPRSNDDFQATVPEASIAEAREAEPGQVLSITGVALNGWAAFGDGTVHLTGTDAAIRLQQNVNSYVAAGDSIRVTGVLTIGSGQPVISTSSTAILGRAAPVTPELATTEAAATAAAGVLDARLVRTSGASIDTILVVAGETQLVIDDGSGPLSVVLDRDTGIGTTDWAVGDPIEVTGLLVPATLGTWVLKPRTKADLREP